MLWKKDVWTMIAAVSLGVTGAVTVARAQTAPSLQGVWRVTEVVVTGANATTDKSPQPGLYIFTKEHYSIMEVQGPGARGQFGPAKDPAKLTDAEKIARYEVWDKFTANSGTYQVSGTTLTTRPLVAKNPSVMTGPSMTREFRIQGNTLTLVLKSRPGEPVSESRTTLTRVE
jgi:hypothetical protein